MSDSEKYGGESAGKEHCSEGIGKAIGGSIIGGAIGGGIGRKIIDQLCTPREAPVDSAPEPTPTNNSGSSSKD